MEPRGGGGGALLAALGAPGSPVRPRLRAPRHAGDAGGPLGRELSDVLEEALAVDRARVDEVRIDQSIARDDMCHAEQQSDVGADADRQIDIGDLGERDASWIDDDHLRALAQRFLEAGCSDRVALCHVRADAEDHIRLLHVDERVRHRTTTDRGRQTGDRRSVSSTAAVVNLMRPEAGTDELLHRVGGLGRSATRSDAVDAGRAVVLERLAEA